MGHTSSGRTVSGTDLVGYVTSLDKSQAPGGFNPLRKGWGSSPGAWSAPFLGECQRAKGILGDTGRIWAKALRPDPPLERPCATLVRMMGRSINTVEINQLNNLR